MPNIKHIRDSLKKIKQQIDNMEHEKEDKSRITLATDREEISVTIEEYGIKIISRGNNRMAQELRVEDTTAKNLKDMLKELYE